MASETVYLQVAKAVWDWIQNDVSGWMRALGDLKTVLMAHDLESDDTVIYALRFSAFSISIAVLIDLAAKIIFGTTPSYTRFAADFILYYVVTFVYAICCKVVAVLMRSKVSLRACFMMALFATVYWAPVNLLDYITFSDLQVRRMLTLGFFDFSTGSPWLDIPALSSKQLFILSMVATLTFIIYLYVAIKMISASRYVFKVGGLRATIIVFGSVSLHDVIQMTLMRPVFEAALD
jgi:pimeloyl-ACP methyl ester carboxylesterase